MSHNFTSLTRSECTWFCTVLCFLGLHRWPYPGGECECCGIADDLFEEKKEN